MLFCLWKEENWGVVIRVSWESKNLAVTKPWLHPQHQVIGVHFCNPRTHEVEAGRSQIERGNSKLPREFGPKWAHMRSCLGQKYKNNNQTLLLILSTKIQYLTLHDSGHHDKETDITTYCWTHDT